MLHAQAMVALLNEQEEQRRCADLVENLATAGLVMTETMLNGVTMLCVSLRRQDTPLPTSQHAFDAEKAKQRAEAPLSSNQGFHLLKGVA